MDITRGILENPINSLRNMPMKKDTLGKNSYVEEILIRTTLSCCAVLPFVESKS